MFPAAVQVFQKIVPFLKTERRFSLASTIECLARRRILFLRAFIISLGGLITTLLTAFAFNTDILEPRVRCRLTKDL